MRTLGVVLVALLLMAMPARAQVSITPFAAGDLDSTMLNSAFQPLLEWINNEANAFIRHPNIRFASNFLDESTTCGIQEAINDLPGTVDGGTIYLASSDVCTTVSTQITANRRGLVIAGTGPALANTNAAPSQIVWTGAADTAVMKFANCKGCSFRDFVILADNDVGVASPTAGVIGVHLEADSSSSFGNQFISFRNVSIRKLSDAIVVVGTDDATFNDQSSEIILDNLDIREVERCYHSNGVQVVNVTQLGGACNQRFAGPGMYLERGWLNSFGTHFGGHQHGHCSTTTTTICTNDGHCDGEETCVLEVPGPAILKGVNGGAINLYGTYTELRGNGIVCETPSTHARPLLVSGGRLNMKANPDSEDPDNNYALIDCDQNGPIVLDGVTLEADASGLVGDMKLYDTPVIARGISVIGSNVTNESRVRWVHGDPRLTTECKTLKIPDIITATDDIASLWQAPWRTVIGSISCRTDTGTITANLTNDDGTPAAIASSNLSCDSTGAETTALESAQTVIAKDDWLGLDIATIASGSPTELTMCWGHRR